MTYRDMDPEEAIQSWLQDMANIEQRWEFLMENGSWGDTEQPDQVVETANKIIEEVNPEQGKCYRNCFRAVLHSSINVDYVEGLAMTENRIDPTEHAWLEIDSSVIELTWKHRTDIPTPPDNAVYYGVSIDSDQVRDLALTHDHTGPFLPEMF